MREAGEPAPGARTVVLVGLPASGKSTVGRVLANRLGLPFTDTDAAVQARTGRSIPDIFAAEGEAGFRRHEAEAILELLPRGGVLALGGGAVTIPEVRAALAGRPVVWLTVDRDEAMRRAAGGVRPLLSGPAAGATWERLRRERASWYAGVATLRVDTTGLGPAEAAERIAADLARASSVAEPIVAGGGPS